MNKVLLYSKIFQSMHACMDVWIFFFCVKLDYMDKAFSFLFWCCVQSMKFGWRLIVGSIVGFLGSAFGTVGGVGGGGIFVPMLTLIVGFDQKSATAISKCKNLYIYT